MTIRQQQQEDWYKGWPRNISLLPVEKGAKKGSFSNIRISSTSPSDIKMIVGTSKRKPFGGKIKIKDKQRSSVIVHSYDDGMLKAFLNAIIRADYGQKMTFERVAVQEGEEDVSDLDEATMGGAAMGAHMQLGSAFMQRPRSMIPYNQWAETDTDDLSSVTTGPLVSAFEPFSVRDMMRIDEYNLDDLEKAERGQLPFGFHHDPPAKQKSFLRHWMKPSNFKKLNKEQQETYKKEAIRQGVIKSDVQQAGEPIDEMEYAKFYKPKAPKKSKWGDPGVDWAWGGKTAFHPKDDQLAVKNAPKMLKSLSEKQKAVLKKKFPGYWKAMNAAAKGMKAYRDYIASISDPNTGMHGKGADARKEFNQAETFWGNARVGEVRWGGRMMEEKTRKQRSIENKKRFAKLSPEQKAATKGDKPFHPDVKEDDDLDESRDSYGQAPSLGEIFTPERAARAGDFLSKWMKKGREAQAKKAKKAKKHEGLDEEKTRKQRSAENKARFAKMSPKEKAATKGDAPFHPDVKEDEELVEGFNPTKFAKGLAMHIMTGPMKGKLPSSKVIWLSSVAAAFVKKNEAMIRKQLEAGTLDPKAFMASFKKYAENAAKKAEEAPVSAAVLREARPNPKTHPKMKGNINSPAFKAHVGDSDDSEKPYHKGKGIQKEGEEKWIAGAIKRPGALKKKIEKRTKKGTIPADELKKAAKKPGRTGQQARLAQTLRKLNK